MFYCENISKKYNDKPVIENISLELNKGGFISLLGPSGVGKTTLFNILAGVEKPDSGSVFLNRENITGCGGRVSYMLQKDLLLEYRTVLDNVILPLLIRGEDKRQARQRAAEFFPMFGLAGYEKKYPNELSGGMRQRAALLRTCLMQNPVILLDEPFSALDAITRRKMQSWYSGIAEQLRFSTFFITHDVDEALILSDTVYIMTGGLVSQGECAARGEFVSLYETGKISHKIDVKPLRPREHDFSVSREFAEQKRFILEAIGL